MARILRFVDYEYSKTGGAGSPALGEILLDLISDDYCMDIEFDIPSPAIEWVDPAHLNGREVSRYKYPNIEVHVTGHVYGTDKADLSTNIRALFEQFNASNPILEWRPEGWADSLFIDLIDPPIDIYVSDWFEAKLRDNPFINVLANIDVTCEAKPFGRRPEETIWIAQHLGTNDSFKDWTGANLDDWTITTAGGGTVTEDNVNELDGGACVDLSTAGGGADSAQIEDTGFRQIDPDSYYDLRVYTKKLAGTVSFDAYVRVYDAGAGFLGTHTVLANDDVGAAWEDPLAINDANGGVITPAHWAAWPTATQVKIRFINDSVVAGQMVLDCCWFGQTDYYINEGAGGIETAGITHRMENPANITIPADDLKGDVPTPARMYFTRQQYYGQIHRNAIVSSFPMYDSPAMHLVTYDYAGGGPVQGVDYLGQGYENAALAGNVFRFDAGIEARHEIATCRGRYLPVVKFRSTLVDPEYVDIYWQVSITGITTTVYLTDNTVRYFRRNIDPDWYVTGHREEVLAGVYSGFVKAFDPISVPFTELPEGVDGVGIYQDYSLYCTGSAAGDVSIDWVMFVPIYDEYDTFCKYGGANIPTFDTAGSILFSGVDRRIFYNAGTADEPEEFASLPGVTVGGCDLRVFPNEGTNIVLWASDYYPTGGGAADFETNPKFTPDIKLTYDPLYLLVSEG